MSNFDPTFQFDYSDTKSLIESTEAKIRAWIDSAPFRDLVELFGGEVPPDGNLNLMLQKLEAFSDRWDFRRMARERGVVADDNLRSGVGSARWLTSATGLSAEADQRIVQDALELGLVRANDPDTTKYDCILVLGGARLSCYLRSIRAAEVIRSGVEVGEIGLLGAARPVADTERNATDTYAPGAVDEFDLIIAGAQKAIGFDDPPVEEERHDHPGNGNLSWIVRRFQAKVGGDSFRIVAVSAPSSDPEKRRANSADTMIFFLDHEHVPEGSRLLLITSQIYVPYVQLEAIRTIGVPRRLTVETIGFPGDRMADVQGLSNPNHYLQEMRSAIQAARRFCEAYSC